MSANAATPVPLPDAGGATGREESAEEVEAALASTDEMQRSLRAVARQMRGANRRGPMRPGRLISARARVRGEAMSRTYRFADAAVMLGLAWIACDLVNPAGAWRTPVDAVAPFLGTAVLLLAGLRGLDAYGFGAREGLGVHLWRVGAGVIAAGAVLAAAAAVGAVPRAQMPGAGLWFTAAFCTLIGLHVAWWLTTRAMRRSGRLTPNIVIVGATANAERLIARAIESREIAVLGIFDDRLDRAPDEIHGVPVLGDTDALMSHRMMPYVDRVVITVSSMAQVRVNALAAKLAALPNDVTLMVDVGGGDDAHAAALSRLLDAPLAQMSGVRSDERRAFAKRVQDLVVGAVALILALPIMALVALAVRLDSPGPILFSQRRHGFNNEDIVVWKFRSMHHALRDDAAERQIEAEDARVTRVGRFIRNTSLDELPQLFNVMRGEMSLVGPRPHAPGTKTGDTESARLVAEYAHRHRMKPGMTGWAAIKGSRGAMTTPDQVRRRVALDIEYIERQSFWLDLYIMAMTLPCLLGDRQGVR
jgi:Undecaprenyl-phosphate glucose phosphotransferase